ncbi:unnamed protein product [Didymodactylos carnosus]|uniref:Uncharacterized protein n=1 Tax=Didymodactylos carnosus TaxID=1234261 RepID=A0A815X6S1_9BILA|nr:unnamed protein product [Didymodactylos carnosus]CAF4412641.1 unnamed protein product [Didymodactylos carnosus]
MVASPAGDVKTVKKLLSKETRGANLITASSGTVLHMDATGPMSSLLTAVKETVCTMPERALAVVEGKDLNSDAF